MTCAVALAAARVSAQPSALLRAPLTAASTTTDSTRITVRLAGVPIADALEQLVQASRISLVYDPSLLARTAPNGQPVREHRVFCRVTAAPPEQLLQCIVRDAGLDFYRLSSGTYVVIATAEALPSFGSLSGVVLDEETRRPIAQAVVEVTERADARMVNGAGHFAFTALPPGRYRVTVRAMGYAPIRTELDVPARGQRREQFALTASAVRAAPVVVNGIQPGAAAGARFAATLDSSRLTSLVQGPGLVVPGAPLQLGLTRRDGIGDLHLQGGEAGEHLWRLDGVPVFDAASLGGLFGSFAPLAIDQLTVQRAGFGAREGSLTAGVLDLAHGVSTGTVPTMRAQLDPMAAHLRLDLPLQVAERRWDSRITTRTGLWPWYAPGALSRALTAWNAPDPVLMQRLVAPGSHDSLGARQYRVAASDLGVSLLDVHGATRVDLSPFRQLDASVHLGRSGVDALTTAAVPGGASMMGSDDYAWDTRTGQLRHRWLIGTRLTHSVQLYASRHALTHRMVSRNDGVASSAGAPSWDGNQMQEVGAQTQLAIDGGANWSLDVGGSVVRNDARIDLANGITRTVAADVRVWRAAAHVDATRRMARGVWLDAGLRLTQLGAGGSRWAEPRLALRGEGRASALGSVSWRVAGGTYRQFVNQYDVATMMPIALVPSVRFWLPADGTRGVATAQHLAAEFVAQPRDGWELRIEVYIKRQPTILAFDYASLLDHSAAGASAATLGFIGRARGEAAGLGVRVVRDRWQLARMPMRVEVGYDAGRVERTFPSRFDGRMQPAPWTEPHRALLALEARPTASLRVGARARGVWGRPWALRQAYYDLLSVHRLGDGLPIGDPATSTRPALIDTDVGGSWTRSIGTWAVEVGASVQNALDRRNVLDYTLRQSTMLTPGQYTRDARLLPGRQFLMSMRLSR
jgi:hypothetical protein